MNIKHSLNYLYKTFPCQGILKYSARIFIFCLFAVATLSSLSSSVQFKAGNIFFGGVPSLYNLTLAHFFFERAAHPTISQKVPPYVHYQLSRIYFISGNFNMSIIEAQKELELYPENTRTWYILGLTYGYMNEEQEAIDAFSKFIDTHPDTWAARNDKAWLQFRIGDINGALTTIKPVTRDIDNPWVQNTYGTLLMNNKLYGPAREAFKNAYTAVHKMKEEDWGRAYPGNDQRIHETGLNAMKLSIESNLKLLESK